MREFHTDCYHVQNQLSHTVEIQTVTSLTVLNLVRVTWNVTFEYRAGFKQFIFSHVNLANDLIILYTQDIK